MSFISINKPPNSHKYNFIISPNPIAMLVDKRVEFKMDKKNYLIDGTKKKIKDKTKE